MHPVIEKALLSQLYIWNTLKIALY